MKIHFRVFFSFLGFALLCSLGVGLLVDIICFRKIGILVGYQIDRLHWGEEREKKREKERKKEDRQRKELVEGCICFSWMN